MNYANQFVRFERVGDKVTPVRVRKEWVTYKALNRGGTDVRRFVPVRLSEVGFPRPEETPEPWRSTPVPQPTTRDSLRAAGLIREVGDGLPFLPMGTPVEWSNAVATGPNAWEV